MTLWLMAFSFLAGGLLTPDWVRLRAGLLWDRVIGSKVARGFSDAPAEVRPVAPNNPIKAVRNIAQFFAGCAGFALKHPILCISLALLLLWLAFGLPFGFGKSKDALRLEASLARAEQRIAEVERDLAVYATDRAQETIIIERHVEHNVSEAREDIRHAVETSRGDQGDFAGLYDRYYERYLSVLPNTGADAGHADPSARGSDPMREPPPDRA